jgi:hypothetical protein
MTFDEFLTILEDNKVPNKLIEVIMGDNKDTYVFNVFLEKDAEDGR